MLTLGQKWKFQKTCHNPFYKSFRVVLCKEPLQKTLNIREMRKFSQWEHFENRPSCKGYRPCKMLTLGQNLKFQKICQNPFYKSFRVVLWKKTAPKNIKYSKWEHFETWPSHKGYRPCKMLTLGQNLKFQKICQNPFYKSFRVVLCKKPLQKTLNIREMRKFYKSAIMQTL